MNNWIFYITVNKINSKFYYGVHYTNVSVQDGYIGLGIYNDSTAKQIKKSGKNYPFVNAVVKYGYKNFERTIIKIFPDTEEGEKEAFILERIIVNETLLRSKNCYNCAIGGKGGISPDLYKKVYQFDLKGNFLRSYKNAREAAKNICLNNEISARSAIKNCCRKITNSAYGFYWSYKKNFETLKSKKTREIAQYTITGRFIRKYKSISEAEETLCINSIDQAIRKKWLCGGFQWRYYINDDNIESYESIFTKNKNKKINMFDKNGNLLKTYSSVTECAEKEKLSVSQINRVLKNIIHTHKGFKFKYSQVEDIV